MLAGQTLTAVEALSRFSCFRLAARIDELRKQGYNIYTETVKQGEKEFARYHLVKGKT